MKFGFTVFRFSIHWHIIVPIMGVLFPSMGRTQSLKGADSLTSIHHYEASTEMYNAFLTANPNRVYDQSAAWLGISYNALATYHYREALQANENSRRIRERLRVEDIAENYLQNARIFLEIGLWDSALEQLERAASIPNDDPLVFAQIEQMRAEAYSGKREFSKAELHYQHALDNTIAELGDAHKESAKLLYHIGVFFTRNGLFNQAEEAFLRARHSAGGLTHEEVLHVQIALALGEIALSREKYLAARTWFLHGLDLMDTYHFHGRGGFDAEAYLGLSRADLANGQTTEAGTQIQKALEIVYPEFQSTSDSLPLHPVGYPENPTLAAEVWCQASRCLAPDNLRQLQCLERAMEILERQCRAFQPPPKRIKLIRQVEQVVGQALEICLNSGDTLQKSNAFTWTERARRAILLAQIADPDTTTVYDFPVLDLRLLQERLDEKTAVFSYVEAGGRLYLFAFDSQKSAAIPLMPWRGSAGQIADGSSEAMDNFLHAIQKGDRENLWIWSNTFYNWLIQPAETLLKKKSRLVIIPTEGLMVLPFEVLYAPSKGQANELTKPWQKTPWLASRFELSYALSFRGATGSPPVFGVPMDIRAKLDSLQAGAPVLFSREIRRLNLNGLAVEWVDDRDYPLGEGHQSPIFASFFAGSSYLWAVQKGEDQGFFLFSQLERESGRSKTIAEALRRARVGLLQSKTHAAPAVWWNGRIFQN